MSKGDTKSNKKLKVDKQLPYFEPVFAMDPDHISPIRQVHELGKPFKCESFDLVTRPLMNIEDKHVPVTVTTSKRQRTRSVAKTISMRWAWPPSLVLRGIFQYFHACVDLFRLMRVTRYWRKVLLEPGTWFHADFMALPLYTMSPACTSTLRLMRGWTADQRRFNKYDLTDDRFWNCQTFTSFLTVRRRLFPAVTTFHISGSFDMFHQLEFMLSGIKASHKYKCKHLVFRSGHETPFEGIKVDFLRALFYDQKPHRATTTTTTTNPTRNNPLFNEYFSAASAKDINVLIDQLDTVTIDVFMHGGMIVPTMMEDKLFDTLAHNKYLLGAMMEARNNQGNYPPPDPPGEQTQRRFMLDTKKRRCKYIVSSIAVAKHPTGPIPATNWVTFTTEAWEWVNEMQTIMKQNGFPIVKESHVPKGFRTQETMFATTIDFRMVFSRHE